MKEKIIMILPNSSLADKSKAVLDKMNVSIPIYDKSLESALELANQKIAAGLKVIISRGGTARMLKKNLSIPVIEIKYNFFDFANAIAKAFEMSNRAVVIGFTDAILLANKVCQYTCSIDNEVITKLVTSEKEIVDFIEDHMKIGNFVYIGGSPLVSIATRLRQQSVLIEADEDSIVDAVQDGLYELRIDTERTEKLEMINSILESASSGIFGIDNDGSITIINNNAKKYFSIPEGQTSKLNINELIPHFNIMDRVRAGDVINGKVIHLGRYLAALNLSPIIIDETVKGAVGIIQESEKIHDMDHQIRKKLINKGHLSKNTFDDIIGESSIMKSCKQKGIRFAKVDSNVLILGKTGTGKEVFAQSIHNGSSRRFKPFVAINCAALPETLLESELFGYVKGAFTGASNEGKAGIFELAHTGTIFLDEISEIPGQVQAKLLRVIQEKEITRIGDTKTIPVDVRIIAASNKDLLQEVEDGIFREDLYYRLCVLVLELPTLNERIEDIPSLARYFVDKFSSDFSKYNLQISTNATNLLCKMEFKGNVRHLANIIERAVVLCDSNLIDMHVVMEAINMRKPAYQKSASLGSQAARPAENRLLSELEADLIIKTLKENHGNKTATAGKLGISYSTLWRKLKNLEKDSIL